MQIGRSKRLGGGRGKCRVAVSTATVPRPVPSHYLLEHDPNSPPNEEPLTQVRSELWTMRANLETLRTRAREVEGLHDVRGLREEQEAYLPGSAKLKNASLCIMSVNTCAASY